MNIIKNDKLRHKNTGTEYIVVNVTPKVLTLKVIKVQPTTPAYIKVGNIDKTTPNKWELRFDKIDVTTESKIRKLIQTEIKKILKEENNSIIPYKNNST